jgi:hypothetical protein
MNVFEYNKSMESQGGAQSALAAIRQCGTYLINSTNRNSGSVSVGQSRGSDRWNS